MEPWPVIPNYPETSPHVFRRSSAAFNALPNSYIPNPISTSPLSKPTSGIAQQREIAAAWRKAEQVKAIMVRKLEQE